MRAGRAFGDRAPWEEWPRLQASKAVFPPVKLKEIAEDSNISWQTACLGQGTKGPVYADAKCLRCVSCATLTDLRELYGSRNGAVAVYPDGSVKYFISNAPEDTPRDTLDRLAEMRWAIEQCFAECKGCLGMTHYESRTYRGRRRHMFMAMAAYLFALILRQSLKKTLFFNAYDEIHGIERLNGYG